ncbi:hypothetical protein R70723_24050 [Paenibacillus sp. FSL R7-0273]|uniref:hypothetical protein n=1 Tax=Paenibacillus sp. FSL R7-0273 TaxID=1536772 RepID=UPI0004F6A925|nr:hypothetical protein [Paenibacillus sp. FSL R7-0273]AIQ48639.1 hypothetical protein R70723_24050 [Paenibacillus sp. FSL R7-0273]OMF94018.1 hypothetical protein BK144_10520 [Paenibacillus sp. FSL R7-0273]
MINIEPFIQKVLRTLDAHRSEQEGGYRRMLADPPEAAELYGTADAAILLYTLGELPAAGSAEHEGLSRTLQGFQQPEDGLFPGAGHHAIHSTAFAVSALELLDAKPLHPLKALHPLKERSGLAAFLDGLDWKHQPWGESTKGAGVYAALVLAEEADNEWEDWYFDWLWKEADPETGLWRQGAITGRGDGASDDGAPLFHHLAGSFHYLFNQDCRKRRLRYPEQLADTCLTLFQSGQIPLSEGSFSFVELDVLYLVVSVMGQTSHRAEELKEMVQAIGGHLLAFIAGRAAEPADEVYEDLHTLCGSVCALAIVQSVLPEQVQADRVLNKVLDRRPFI